MEAFGPYFAESERFYRKERRRRAWAASGRQGLQGYAAYLAGNGELVDAELGGIVGAETAAFSDASSVWRPILIGVTTGALTFLVNRWLGKIL